MQVIEPVGTVEVLAPLRAATSARRKPDLAAVPAAEHPAAGQHPAMVYLASLAPGSRRAVRSSLQVCAELLGSVRSEGSGWFS
jgi:hypothetical protein